MGEAQQVAERAAGDDRLGHGMARAIDFHRLDAERRLAARRGGMGEHVKRGGHHRAQPEIAERHRRIV